MVGVVIIFMPKSLQSAFKKGIGLVGFSHDPLRAISGISASADGLEGRPLLGGFTPFIAFFPGQTALAIKDAGEFPYRHILVCFLGNVFLPRNFPMLLVEFGFYLSEWQDRKSVV